MRNRSCRSAQLLVLLIALLGGPPGARSADRDFGRDWRFARGEQPAEAAAPAFDDSAWDSVRLPHDWAIAGPFNPDENGYAGKLPWRGEGWYRKTFSLDGADAGKQVYIDFDGVMAFPKVYINGALAGEWDYGYTAFRVDATPHVRFGASNTVAVHVDTRKQGTRWYPGAGIYRKVTLAVRHPVHLAHWGTFVTTPEIGVDQASVQVETTVENHDPTEADVTVEIDLLGPDGKVVASKTTSATVAPEGAQRTVSSFQVPDPKRWDIDTPRLYMARALVRTTGREVDRQETPFGIRTFRFTADDGFYLNDRRVQLFGVNLHHDHGPLGAAFYPRAMERQLEIMRDMGVNAIRTSHNPPAAELLDLCDRMGLLVWDEVFDKWDDKAGRVDGKPPLKDYGKRHVRSVVLRDRNHPSVVVWSIGNEIGNQPYDREGKSPARVRFMSDFVRLFDPTRPVGIGCHIPGTADEPILNALDFTGWNYARRYARYRENYPDRPIIYSESASTLSTRGFYEPTLPNEKTEYSDALQVCSYDLNAAAWSDIPDAEFALMEQDRFVAGEFVWTGFDYLGEPTPFTQEARSSYFGIVDLCGIPKDRFYLYRSHWRPDTTTVHILPHWNWPEQVGQTVPVFVYTNGDSAELFLNGTSLGRRTKGPPPARPENYALGRPVHTSSSETARDHLADHAVDGDRTTRWTAAAGATGEWWQVDLGRVTPVRYLFLEFEKEAKLYGYRIDSSTDGDTWSRLADKPTSRTPRWGGPKQAYHHVDTETRFLRVTFTDLRDRTWAGLHEFGAYPEPAESPYYDVTYRYRLRWNDVVYQPGELKAVAYKNGRRIGDATVRTTGAPAALRLTPDRTRLTATGNDLCYILVEALDADGLACPLADDLVQFAIEGPAEIAGVGNGNPLSIEPFQADSRQLFHGKAMLILRTDEGPGGPIRVRATSEGLSATSTDLRAMAGAE